MDNKIYLHGISTQSSSFDFEKSLEKLREILRSEFLLSRRNLGLSEAQAGFNGLDYISLCDYEKRTLENGSRDMYNAYYAYIYNNLALAFPKNRFDRQAFCFGPAYRFFSFGRLQAAYRDEQGRRADL